MGVTEGGAALRRVFVVGVGMTKFEKPGTRDWDYPDMAREAGTLALSDAGVDFDEVQQAVASYVMGLSTSGQRSIYELGLTGIPVSNVNNNCASGSTALFLARQLVQGGVADCTLALGFEKMAAGAISVQEDGRESPLARHLAVIDGRYGPSDAPPAPNMFAVAGREHSERYGTTVEQYATAAVKNHRHSVDNPYAQFQKEFTLDEVLSSRMVADPVTILECSPTSDGAAAAILASERFVREHGLEEQAIEIVGQAMTTDTATSFGGSAISAVGYEMTEDAAHQVYEQSGLGPDDVDVIELHDCFSPAEIIMYEALGLCEAGSGGPLVADGATTHGGKWVVNPSGGLMSKGHPLGATGLAQCTELTWQLRGLAAKRQVDGASVALQHNIGLGGAAVVTMYRNGTLV